MQKHLRIIIIIFNHRFNLLFIEYPLNYLSYGCSMARIRVPDLKWAPHINTICQKKTHPWSSVWVKGPHRNVSWYLSTSDEIKEMINQTRCFC